MMVHFNDGNAFDTSTGFRYFFERGNEHFPPIMQVAFPGIGPSGCRDYCEFKDDQALYLRECVIEQARADEQYLMGNLKIGELQAKLRPATPRQVPKCDVVADDRTPF